MPRVSMMRVTMMRMTMARVTMMRVMAAMCVMVSQVMPCVPHVPERTAMTTAPTSARQGIAHGQRDGGSCDNGQNRETQHAGRYNKEFTWPESFRD